MLSGGNGGISGGPSGIAFTFDNQLELNNQLSNNCKETNLFNKRSGMNSSPSQFSRKPILMSSDL